MGNSITVLGLLVVLVGIVVNVLSKFGLPRLPGDILIERDGFTFYFPIVTSIVVSVVLTIVFNRIR